MKRLYLLALLLLVCTGAWAQLNVKSSSSGPEEIETALESKAKLAFLEGRGYLMLIVSSNRYDKGGYFLLGQEPDGAIQTLEDLIGLCDSLGDGNVTVEPWPGRTCLIYSNREGWLVLKFSNHAGRCEVRKKDLEKFQRALEARIISVE